jgi:hypothetical protein
LDQREMIFLLHLLQELKFIGLACKHALVAGVTT